MGIAVPFVGVVVDHHGGRPHLEFAWSAPIPLSDSARRAPGRAII
ncbi:hypothetical protein BTZ20_4151 [Rhodococcus sp. MTM3W5.2]|nr:hypothetical protein BTZ20_4151 [Rhodococcus sp. MTM3W5.2]